MLEILKHESRILKNNPLGDVTERDLYVYLPPGYDSSQTYPALLALNGFTGTGSSFFNRDPLGEALDQRINRLIETKACRPLILVAPDCFNRLGGSQYINSQAIGNYEDYLTQEILPFVESRYKVTAWGVLGKSSGGYGSMVLGMRHPDKFKALACHSGDSNFELGYLPDMKKALDSLKKAGGTKKWLDSFWKDVNHKRRGYHDTLNTIAMAAHYSPNPNCEMGIEYPMDLETGVFKFDIWEKWQAWDPVKMIPKHASNLKQSKLVYIDCGNRDEFGLHWGARAMSLELKKAGVPHFYEEFDDGHMSVSYRLDVSIPQLVKALIE